VKRFQYGFLLKVSVCVLVLTFCSLDLSKAEESKLAVNPSQILFQNQPKSFARGVLFQENPNLTNSVGFIRDSMWPTSSRTPDFNSILPNAPEWWDYHKCISWEDLSCPNDVGWHLDGLVQMGFCKNPSEIGCVESLAISQGSGSLEELSFKGPAYSAVVDLPESKKYGIPRSSSPAIFTNTTGDSYLLRAGLWVVVDADVTHFKLDVDVNPIVPETEQWLGAPEVMQYQDQVHHTGVVSVSNSPPDCLATSVVTCYRALKWHPKTSIKVRLRIPKKMSGWMRGRIANQQISVSPLNSISELLEVSGETANVPIAGGWVKYSDLPANFIQGLYPYGGYDQNPESSYSLSVDPSQRSEGIKEFNAWIPYLKDQAMTTLTSWSFGTNLGTEPNSCLRGDTQLVGFVGTNATAYSSEPPQWEANSNTLSYQVAAPHLDETGMPTVGSYTLSIPTSVFKCLYQTTNVPTSATVQLIYSDGKTELSTVLMQTVGNWFNFSVNGFHYSNPKIVIHFNVSKIDSQKNPGKVPINKSLIELAKCNKGKITIKLKSLLEKCPPGFKKI